MKRAGFGLICAAATSLSFGAWYDAPEIKATVNIRGDYPSNLMMFMNMSADGQSLMAPLHAENDSYPVQVYSVATLTGATGWVSPAQAGAKSAFASSTYGTKWKGGAISSAGMVMGSGQSSGVTFPFLALPADSWTKDSNAFAVTGLGTAGSDGMDFSADGSRLYCNSATNKTIILEYDASNLATGHAVTLLRTITTAAARVRNLSCYAIGGKTLVYFGEGAVSTGAKSVYVWNTTTAAPTALLTNGDIAGDITNVKVSGISRGKPRLYVLTDAGQLFVYALNADGLSLASKAPIKAFTSSEVSALCGINGTVITSGFKNFEVTDNGRFAFFAHHAEGNIAAPGICVVYTETENEAVWADPNAVATRNGDKTVISFTQNGTLTLTRPVTMEVLLVGGGGGGGGRYGSDDQWLRAGGGGGGGVIHKTSFVLAAGDYSIVIGNGGEINSNWNTDTAMGGTTTAFGLSAFGGGWGAMSLMRSGAGNGASGGGHSCGWADNYPGWRTSALYTGSPYYNLGNAGGYPPPGHYAGGGGGGGAGTAGNGQQGGDGYACSITGSEVYYAGGGGGDAGCNGKGGGAGSYGGGGTGGALNVQTKGGQGIVIVSFVDEAKTEFDDATGGTVKKSRDENGLFITHTFTADGTFTLPHAAQVEVLVVGGGGGGGGKWAKDSDTSYCGGGGGGGGVIHKATLTLAAGEYPISIGAGGVVHNNWNHGAATGGKTTAFDLTAMGGGAGQMCYSRNGGWTGTGASGGGGAKGQYSVTYGAASYGGDPYYNLGNNGAAGSGIYGGGGGGGGAGTAANGTYGGDGYACSITGTEVYYAGGGGGKNNRNGKGGGSACYGGGGCGGEGWIAAKNGGSGVVIIRYARLPKGLIIMVK